VPVLPKADPPESPETGPAKTEASPPKVETSPPELDAAPPPPPKVDYATDLFNMLSMDGPSGNQPGPSSSHGLDSRVSSIAVFIYSQSL